jgi:hypothetical protein
MSKMRGQHNLHKGPAHTEPRPRRGVQAKIVDRKPLKVPATRHPKTGGRRRHEPLAPAKAGQKG